MPSSTSASPAPATPTTGVASLALRLRRQLPRTLTYMVLLCSGITLLLTALEGRGLLVKAVYSFSIGLCCVTLTDLGRLGAAWFSDRMRRARGLAPDVDAFESGWRGVGVGVLLSVLGGPLLGTLLADAITGNRSPGLWNLASTGTRLTLVLSLLATVISVFVLSTLERLASARAQAEAAQRQAAETQLRLLQSQLEPHMLFNTLANLRVLITLDPPRAQAMLDHLIAFLRATLQASRTGEHALALEFDRLSDYLALMAVRMGPRLQVQLDLPTALRQVPVPPLLLQSLVENSIQHGLEPQVEGGRIHVAAHTQGADLVLTVHDTGVGLPAGGAVREGGFGVAQVRERLATLYGGAASLTIEPAGDAAGGTRATVRLPLPPPSATTRPPP